MVRYEVPSQIVGRQRSVDGYYVDLLEWKISMRKLNGRISFTSTPRFVTFAFMLVRSSVRLSRTLKGPATSWEDEGSPAATRKVTSTRE